MSASGQKFMRFWQDLYGFPPTVIANVKETPPTLCKSTDFSWVRDSMYACICPYTAAVNMFYEAVLHLGYPDPFTGYLY